MIAFFLQKINIFFLKKKVACVCVCARTQMSRVIKTHADFMHVKIRRVVYDMISLKVVMADRTSHYERVSYM